MNIESLFADPNLLQLERISFESDRITLIVKTAPKSALCPRCHTPSAHLHNRYIRRLADLPRLGIAIRVEVRAWHGRAATDHQTRRVVDAVRSRPRFGKRAAPE